MTQLSKYNEKKTKLSLKVCINLKNIFELYSL